MQHVRVMLIVLLFAAARSIGMDAQALESVRDKVTMDPLNNLSGSVASSQVMSLMTVESLEVGSFIQSATVADEWRYFKVVIPAGSRTLRINLSALSYPNALALHIAPDVLPTNDSIKGTDRSSSGGYELSAFGATAGNATWYVGVFGLRPALVSSNANFSFIINVFIFDAPCAAGPMVYSNWIGGVTNWNYAGNHSCSWWLQPSINFTMLQVVVDFIAVAPGDYVTISSAVDSFSRSFTASENQPSGSSKTVFLSTAGPTLVDLHSVTPATSPGFAFLYFAIPDGQPLTIIPGSGTTVFRAVCRTSYYFWITALQTFPLVVQIDDFEPIAFYRLLVTAGSMPNSVLTLWSYLKNSPNDAEMTLPALFQTFVASAGVRYGVSVQVGGERNGNMSITAGPLTSLGVANFRSYAGAAANSWIYFSMMSPISRLNVTLTCVNCQRLLVRSCFLPIASLYDASGTNTLWFEANRTCQYFIGLQVSSAGGTVALQSFSAYNANDALTLGLLFGIGVPVVAIIIGFILIASRRSSRPTMLTGAQHVSVQQPQSAPHPTQQQPMGAVYIGHPVFSVPPSSPFHNHLQPYTAYPCDASDESPTSQQAMPRADLPTLDRRDGLDV